MLGDDADQARIIRSLRQIRLRGAPADRRQTALLFLAQLHCSILACGGPAPFGKHGNGNFLAALRIPKNC
jgi:hypothetical protein